MRYSLARRLGRAPQRSGALSIPSSGAVLPGMPSPSSKEVESQKGHKGGGGDDPDLSALLPFIQGLLKTLPEPESDWPVDARMKWLQTAANIFDPIYKGEGGIKIEAAMAQLLPRPDADQ